MATLNQNPTVPAQAETTQEIAPIPGVKVSRGVKEGKGWTEIPVTRDDVMQNDNVLINATDSTDLERKVALLRSVLGEKGLSIAPKPEPSNAKALWSKHTFLPVTMVTGKNSKGELYKFYKAWVCSLDSVMSSNGGF